MKAAGFFVCLLQPLVLCCSAHSFVRSLIFVCHIYSSLLKEFQRTFRVDYQNNVFLKDGEPFRYISGSIHYFRVHQSDWRDRLRKMRAAGLNAVQIYVEWSSHEPELGHFDFSHNLDLEKFLRTVEEEDLLAILRIGPYEDAERDMGGLPYWLLRENPEVKLRTADKEFTKYVDIWLGSVLLPMVKSFLYENGGPIILIQISNEYGSFPACDFAYTYNLKTLVKSVLGENVVLFTTDGAGTGFLKCGKVQGVFSTVDFGPENDVKDAFKASRLFQPEGPLVNSEFYSGWLDHWNEPHSTSDADVVAEGLDNILTTNASVNIYMFHGGTSFGLSSGSNFGDTYQACPTSYDYDAPLSEAGDPTPKYFMLRSVIMKYLPLPPIPVPAASKKANYGKVEMFAYAGLFELAKHVKSYANIWPLTFEELSTFSGIVVYETVVRDMLSDPTMLNVVGIRDRAYVFVQDDFVGTLSREQRIYQLPLFIRPNQTLKLVVESQGRICYGPLLKDFKGIVGNVTLGGLLLENWIMTPLPLINSSILFSELAKLPRAPASTIKGRLTFYTGAFVISRKPRDTFLEPKKWTKGIAWINSFNLGRYWPVAGPQVTLYVPRGVLKKGINTLLLLELEESPCQRPDSCYVTLKDEPEIDGPTPLKA